MILGLSPDSVLEALSSKPAGLQRICMILGLNPDSVLGPLSRFSFVILILQTTFFTVYLHDLWTKSRFSFWILILQASWFTAYLHDLGTRSRFSFRILIFQKNKMGQISTKAFHPRCKNNFGNLTFRILILQTTWFWVLLHDFGIKSRFSFWSLILQTNWFTAYLHDLGTRSRFSFRILILQKTRWDKFLQKPFIHDAKIILEILLIGSWSSKLPGFECFCMILGLNPDSVLGSLSSKPPGLQRICMILGLNPDSVLGSLSSKPAGLQRICMILGLNLDSVFGSWSFKKRMRRMSTKASNPRCKVNFGNLTFRILILQTT